MVKCTILLVVAGLALLFAPMLHGGDLAEYRQFRFGSGVDAVAKQAGLEPAQAKVIHTRPALIQEIEWRPQGLGSSAMQAEAVQRVVFSFYNGEMFRIVVAYDRYQTQGLTDADLVQAISATYGAGVRPDNDQIDFSMFYGESAKIVARWEDSLYSYNLVRSSYQENVGLVAFSKRTETLARAAIVQALRIEAKEAPQKELDRQKKEADDLRIQNGAARSRNKPLFRP